jgi:uncharacterized integral membrane protein
MKNRGSVFDSVWRYNQRMRMNWIDWLLGIALVALIAVAFGLLLPPYGYIGGALIGVFLAWRALKQRRELLKKHEDEQK